MLIVSSLFSILDVAEIATRHKPTEMDGSSGPPDEKLHTEQTANDTHNEDNAVEDTGWQKDGQEDKLFQEMHSENQEISAVTIATHYPGNVTSNGGDQTTDKGWHQDALSEETCRENCTQPEEGVSSHLHVQVCTEKMTTVDNMGEQTTDMGRCQDVLSEESCRENCTQSEEGDSIEQKGVLDQRVMTKHFDENEKPHMCKECGYRSAYRSGLSRHKKKHTGEIDHKCDLCDYSVTNPHILARHILANHTTGENPYTCKVCDFRTTSKSHMVSHIRAHSRVFKCDQCDYSAKRKEGLERHIRARHTDEKPYMCEECGYRMADLSSLHTHRRKHLWS